MQIERADFVAIPSRDAERSRQFYREVLGLTPDPHGRFEFWAGETCLGIWEPERLGMPFAPSKNGHIALRVPDVAAAVEEVRGAGAEVIGIQDSGVCHMGFCKDPDGNVVILHKRYKPREKRGDAI